MRLILLVVLCGAPLVGTLGCATTDPTPAPTPITTPYELVIGTKTHHSPQAGGDGGTPYVQLCPEGWVVTGIRGGSALYVDRVGVICSPASVRAKGVAARPTRPGRTCKDGDPDRCFAAASTATTDAERARLFRRAAELYREQARAKLRTPRTTRPGGPYGDLFKKVGPLTYVGNGPGLNAELTDLTQLGMQARVIPNYRKGKYEGFKLVGVRPGSLYRAIGIRSGDIVRTVNGKDINTPNKAMELYTQLREAKRLTLVIERRGKLETIVVDFGGR